MATLTPSEIIMSRDRRGLPVSDRVHNVVDTTGGLTDEIYNTEIMRTLGKTAPAYLEESEWDEAPITPDLKAVLSKLGIKAEDDPTGVKAARKFVEEFPKKRDAWKKKVEKDPAFGTRGWETVYDLFKQTSNDLMNYDIAENRRKIATGEDEEGLGWLQTKVANLMFPRVTDAIKEGREPEVNEWGRDIAANAAYAVPVGRIAGAATRGMSPAIKALAQVGSQAAAPVAVATMDNIVDDSRTMDDWSTDALVGTLANLGVNKILAPGIGRAMSSALGKVSSRVPPSVKAVLEGTPTGRELAGETIAQAQREVKNAAKEFNPATLAEGKNPTSKATASTAKDILEVADASTKTLAAGGRKLNPSEVLTIVQDATKGSGKITAADENRVVGSVIQQLEHPNTAPTAKNPHFSKEFKKGVTKYSKVLEANPELKTLFAPPEKLNVSRVLSPLEAYAVNQYGSSGKASDVAGAAFGVDVKKVRDDTAKRKADASTKGAVSQILGGGGLTDEDEKYLRMISENPKILKFSQDDGFKIWLLKRGHQLLQGTPAHRPLWEVE